MLTAQCQALHNQVISRSDGFHGRTSNQPSSVLDRQTSYILGESTRTVSLTDLGRFEEGDGLSFGCSAVGKEISMCEVSMYLAIRMLWQNIEHLQNVINLPRIPEVRPIFVVPDLAQDPRFSARPYVTGLPYFKFYAGTPLTTKRGVNIGAFAVIDDRPRSGLDEDQETFLIHVASLVMMHLERRKDAEESKRTNVMAGALNAFIEGKESLSPADHTQSSESSTKHHYTDVFQHQGRPKSASNASSQKSDHVSLSPERAGEESVSSGHFEEARQSTLNRAARLLQESLDLQDAGGVIFLDSAHSTTSADWGVQSYAFDGASSASDAPSSIVCEAVPFDLHPIRMPKRALAGLLSHHPMGRAWTFDDDFSLLSSDDEDPTIETHRRRSSQLPRLSSPNRRQAEADLLQLCFPQGKCNIPNVDCF